MAEALTQEASIEGWTKEEKFYLFEALSKFGSRDLNQVKDHIPTKTPLQIQMAINHYKKIAMNHPKLRKYKNQRIQFRDTNEPLTKWAQSLRDNLPADDLKTETATAIRMIAELEPMPEPAAVDNIDFKKVYHTIADAMEGKPMECDAMTVAVINKCIDETVLSSKAFIANSSLKHVINSIDLRNKEPHIRSFPQPSEDEELNVLRYLTSQRNYNPLEIPEDFMKPSVEPTLPII